jgi:phenylacetate-CoA ligase
MGTSNQAFPDRAAMRLDQWQRLRALLGLVANTNIFYRQKFKEAGFDPNASLADMGEFVRSCPFTFKEELALDQVNRPPYGSNLTFSLDRYTRFHQTSGTSGRPLRWLDTPESWDWMLRLWEQVYTAAGVGSRDRVFCAFSFGPFIGFWLAFEAAARLGCLAIPGGGLSSAARLRILLDNQVTVLCATPTYAIRLAEVAALEGISLEDSKVRTILVAGEPGGSIPATRQRLQELWPGAIVFDHHGMTEVGPVTLQCPDQPGRLHVMESGYLPEVVDSQTGQAVEPGQPGELILTTLARTGAPLIRYRTRDLVKAVAGEGPCSCGRFDLALEGGILGRSDDMVVMRGVNVYPSAVEEIIRSCSGVAEYRVEIQRKGTTNELHLTVEPEPGCTDPSALKHQLEQAMQNALALRVPVTMADPGSLPRFEMKARRWVTVEEA